MLKSIYELMKKVSYSHIVQYPTPQSLNYFWNFGSLSGFNLVLQILSGLFLAMHYEPAIDLAFGSVQHIMRDVQGGWYLRYLHANGASFFFAVVYLHMARSLFYKSYKERTKAAWLSGLVIFILMMATAFLGYVLPWGQMSYWGATVITNLFSVIPWIGESMVHWLWGGYAVGGPTLTRFFALHFILPFFIVFLVIIHIIQLHEVGSSKPSLNNTRVITSNIKFYPYFFHKDLLGFLCFILLMLFVLCWFPEELGHPDNSQPADPLVTPAHIVPEWYFLPFYAILRSVPDKSLGILAMASSIGILFILPFSYAIFDWIYIHIVPNRLKQLVTWLLTFPPFTWYKQWLLFLQRKAVKHLKVSSLNELGHRYAVIDFIITFIFLGFLGAAPAEEPFVTFSWVFTCAYFMLLLDMMILDYLPVLKENE